MILNIAWYRCQARVNCCQLEPSGLDLVKRKLYKITKNCPYIAYKNLASATCWSIYLGIYLLHPAKSEFILYEFITLGGQYRGIQAAALTILVSRKACLSKSVGNANGVF